MTDEDALMRAVIADPDDDAPRLIFADWLDENGQCERAEFIRVQIALAEMATNDERRPELRRCERRLLRRWGNRWTQALRPAVFNYIFRRGFVESVVCIADEFLSNGKPLFALAPIRFLWLTGAHHCSQQLGQCPYLNRPISLVLNRTWLGDRDIYHLADSPFFGKLIGLSLSHNRITGIGAIRLARSPYLGSLDDLDLSGNPIPGEARTELRHRFGTRVHF
jgi:uncharacterized protein (TIGR02996 family)